jgi:three-Cys-motif partner protein
MSDHKFFDESTEQSQIKARIVAKYFWAWAKVIIPTAKKKGNRIAYMDLFAGAGRYKDGTISTPLLVLKTAIADEDMKQMLVTYFNDGDAGNASSLQRAIDDLPGIEKLRYKPTVDNKEVGAEIVQMFSKMNLVPTFFFVDPWGYKGLSLSLINAALKNWGCDCVFFFNYNRINMALNNDIVREHMNVLFGAERADTVRQKLNGLSPYERETLIVEEISLALKEMGVRFVLPFSFQNEVGKRTTHHLIFASKDFRGYDIMKGIMAQESSEYTQGVASFEYSPASENLRLLFELTRPLDDLEGMLLQEFAGRTLTVQDIYEQHSVGRPYVQRNYKQLLTAMEAAGKIIVDPPANLRRKKKGTVTLADHVRVAFPKRSAQ